jgi:hypothetical protein
MFLFLLVRIVAHAHWQAIVAEVYVNDSLIKMLFTFLHESINYNIFVALDELSSLKTKENNNKTVHVLLLFFVYSRRIISLS